MSSHRPGKVKWQLDGIAEALGLFDGERIGAQHRGGEAAEGTGARGDNRLKVFQAHAKEGPAADPAQLSAGQETLPVDELAQLQLEDAGAADPLHKEETETHKRARSEFSPAGRAFTPPPASPPAGPLPAAGAPEPAQSPRDARRPSFSAALGSPRRPPSPAALVGPDLASSPCIPRGGGGLQGCASGLGPKVVGRRFHPVQQRLSLPNTPQTSQRRAVRYNPALEARCEVGGGNIRDGRLSIDSRGAQEARQWGPRGRGVLVPVAPLSRPRRARSASRQLVSFQLHI